MSTRNLLQKFNENNDKTWIGNNPHDPENRFLLYDSVHLMKRIRNNCFTEKWKTNDFLFKNKTVTRVFHLTRKENELNEEN